MPSSPFKIDLILISIHLVLVAVLFVIGQQVVIDQQISGVMLFIIFLPLIILKTVLAIVALVIGIKYLPSNLRQAKAALGIVYGIFSFANAFLLVLIAPQYTLFPSILLFSVLWICSLYLSIWRLANIQKKHYQIVGFSHLAVFAYLYGFPLIIWIMG